jgi:hypothetical protein
MTEEEILNEITEMEWSDSDRLIGRTVFSPEKLAAFLAKHLPAPEVTNTEV